MPFLSKKCKLFQKRTINLYGMKTLWIFSKNYYNFIIESRKNLLKFRDLTNILGKAIPLKAILKKYYTRNWSVQWLSTLTQKYQSLPAINKNPRELKNTDQTGGKKFRFSGCLRWFVQSPEANNALLYDRW